MNTRKNIVYNVLLAISQVVFPLITFPYLARTLGPTQIGLLNFAEGIAKYFILLAALGIPIYGVREIAKQQDQASNRTKLFIEIFAINAIMTILLSGVFVIMIQSIPRLQEAKELYYWSIGYFVSQMFYVEWFFSGMNQFKFIAIRSLVIRCLFIVFVFILIKEKADYIKYMQMQVGLNIVIALINLRQLKALLPFKVVDWTTLDLKQHIKPLLILFLTIFSISIYFSLDTILLGFMAGNESVGYYTTALKLTKLIIAVMGAITVAMFPKMMHLYHNGAIEKFANMVQQAFYVVISLALPLIVVLFCSASEIVHVLFGHQYEQAILCLQITTPLLLIVSLSGIFGFQVLSALAKDKSILTSTVIGMTISIVLSFLLVPYLKALGESITIVLTELSVCVSFIYFTHKYFTLKGYSKVLLAELPMLIPYFVFILVTKMLLTNEIYRLVVIAIGASIWFIVYHTMITKNKLLFEQVKNLMRSKQN